MFHSRCIVNVSFLSVTFNFSILWVKHFPTKFVTYTGYIYIFSWYYCLVYGCWRCTHVFFNAQHFAFIQFNVWLRKLYITAYSHTLAESRVRCQPAIKYILLLSYRDIMYMKCRNQIFKFHNSGGWCIQ